MSTENNKPGFNVFIKAGNSENAPLVKVGAVWNHSKGNGFNIKLSAHSITGDYVCFELKEDEETVAAG